MDDTAALVREVAPGPAARAVKRVDGKFVPVIDVDGETFHLRVDGEWHKGEPAQSVMIAGRGARTDQTTAAYRTVESAVEAAQSELGFRGRPPATSDIDAAVSAEAAPVAATQPKAPEFRDTRGEGLRLHGTPSEDLPLDEGHYTTKNFYGQGVYTTDAVDIAAGYAGRGKKTSGSDGTVFVVRPREGLKVLDMEEPVPAWIVAHVDQDRSSLGELAGIALEEGPTNLRELYDTIRDISREEGRSADDVQEIFEAFQEVIQAQGFHGMRHVGGLKTKKAPHDVTIYFNSADVTTEPLDLAEFRVARGAETAASASARLQAVLDQRRHATRVPTPEEIANRPIAGGATARFAPGQDTHAFVGQLRGRPFRGESGRATTGVPEAAATPQAERLRDISERVVAALGLTVRQGRLQRVAGKKPLGTFNEKSGVVRMRELDAFDVLAHEGGHGLHLMPEFRADIDALIGRHQIEVERLAYPGTPQGQEGVEGFAEWFRLWLTNPGYAKREAPQFTEAAENWLRQNRPRMLDDLVAAQSAYREWLRAPSRDVVTGDLVSSGAPPIKERVGRALETDRAPSGESLMSMFGRFYTWTLDRLHPVNRSVRVLLDIHKRNTGQSIDLPAASDPYKLLRLATSAHQAGHIDLLHGVVPYRSVEPQGPSLAEGLELAVGKNWHGAWRSDELIDFGAYLVARRSVIEFHRFMAGEVPNPPGKLTLGDYRQAVSDFDAAYPNFAHAAQLIYKWQTNLLKKKFEAGLVSRSYYDKALAKPDYVPFQRDFSEKVEELIRPAGAGGTNRQSAMKTYRGSLRSIINPIESMMSEAYSTAAIIARNDAITMLADLAKKAGPGGGAIAEAIPASVVTPIRVDVMQALRNAGKDAGLDKADIDDLVLAASERLDAEDVIATLYKAGDAPEKGEPIVYYWRGGERHALRLADRRFGKDLYEAITQLGAEQSNWIINLLAVPARTLRMGITTSPEFLLANYIRDQTSAFVLNTRFVPFVSGARGMVDEIAQTRAARLYSQAGGLMGGANTASLDQARIGRNINALRRNGTIVRRVSDIRDVIRLTEISESGTRIALFKQYFDAARKQGLSEYEAMVEGAFQARDFIDFGRHGSKMLFARRIVTFMNAALQGTDKTLRTLINDMAPMAKVFRGETLTAGERALVSRSAQAWLKIGVLTGLSATYALMYRDDPEWQQAGEYLRATHWLFKMPGGEWAVVPKPFEMATIMNFGERFAEGLAADDPTWANKWLRSWGYTLAVPIEPAGLMTPAEIGFNFDVFRQMPIVPQWDQGLEPWQQFNQYTSEFSKMVGKAINVSPAKIDHLIVGWTGSWGRNALSVSNMFDPQRRSEQLYDWPISGRFVKNLARGSDATDK
ncbi:MAG: LPD38 domain-containing protein, partial [Hyphomicrobiales bacterium]|nr:LPD38 domain-containing protein [Hyphomicrobiales bacterium]